MMISLNISLSFELSVDQLPSRVESLSAECNLQLQ